MFDVVSLGEALIDFSLISADSDGYPTMAAHPGGAPANFLAAVSKYGGKTALITKLGDDIFAKLLLKTFSNAGISTEGIIVSSDVFTTLAFVTLDDAGDRSFSFARKPGADTSIKASEIPFAMIDQAKVFHFGTLSLTDEPAKSATIAAVEYAKDKGKIISFDPNLREPLWSDLADAKEQMLWGLSRADIVKISDYEVSFLFGLSPEEGAEFIHSHFGVKLVFVTAGEKGSYYKNAVTKGYIPALSGLNVMDTTGAGDIFGGAAVYKVLQSSFAPELIPEAELKKIVLFANTAAGLSTEKRGGISSIPDDSDILLKMSHF